MVYTVPTVVAGPRGLPDEVVKRLHEAFSKTFEDKDALRFFENMKKEPWPMTPAAATAWAKESVSLERRMVERAGMLAK
jgi:tripartite-type tricarboxylate transporter receptor subunit TctC